MADSAHPPPLNFLQNHYNLCRQRGDLHGVYVVVNDLSDETAKMLKDTYERFYQDSIVGRVATLDKDGE